MAKNGALELSIHIAGRVDKSLTAAINTTQNSVSSLTTNLSRIGTVGLAAMGTLFTGSVALISDCVKGAEDFEAKMANVVKYVDGLADEQGKISDKVFNDNGKTYAENYSMVKEAILDLSTQIPYTADELTDLAAAAGQSGKSITDLFQIDANGNIEGFLKDAAMLGTAWDIESGLAGDYAAKWEKAFNMSHEEVMTLADQINYLGANSATTAAEIANTVNKAGSLGQVAGVDVATTAAMADAMLATGVNTDRAGTALKNMFTRMVKGESATKKTKAMWEELGFTAEGIAKSMMKDSTGTTLAVFEAINNLPDYRRMAAISELFGMWSAEGASKIANNMDTYIDALNMVNDPALYEGSMVREFAIKSDTVQAHETMMQSSLKALKDSIGEEFLPIKKQVLDILSTLFTDLRKHTPQLKQLAGTLADIASNGVSKLGNALDVAFPKIQQGLDYVANNGEKVAKAIGGIALAFAGMKAAPLVEGALSLGGNLLFGGGAAAGKAGGGLLSTTLGGLWKGGQNAASTAISGAGMLGQGAALGMHYQASGKGGFFGNIRSGIMGMFGAGQNMGSLLNPKTSGKALENLGTSLFQSHLKGGGLTGMIGNMLGNTKVGQGLGSYFGAVGGQLGNLKQNPIVSAIGGALGQAGGFIGKGFGGLGQGFGMLGSYIGGGIKNATGNAAGGLMYNFASTRVGQGLLRAGGTVAHGIGHGIGAVMPYAQEAGGLALAGGKNLLGAAGGIMSTIGTAASPIMGVFGSILSGALPIVGVISSIIAVVSILGDNLNGIRGIIQNVFGDQGVQIFDMFIEKIQGIGDFIQSLFGTGLIELMSPLRESIVNLFGKDAGTAFDGIVQILQSVMNVIQQIVDFSITYVKPIIEEVINFIVNNALPLALQTISNCAPIVSQIITQVGTLIMRVATVIAQAIQFAWPFIQQILTAVMNFASAALPQLLTAVSNIAVNIGGFIDAIIQVFNGLIEFLTGVFTGNWEQAWQGVCDIFGGIFDALVELAKMPLNAVIGLINGVFAGINSLIGGGITIPEWVPVIGGGTFQMSFPEIPYLAKGGFTNGPSIAGEAGTEAVISFQRGVRNQNIATWAQAGKMLGIDALTQPRELELEDVGESYNYTGGAVTFSPQITINGNADDGVMDRAIAKMQSEFEIWYRQMVRREQRTRY